MVILNWKNPFGLHGLHKNISALSVLKNEICFITYYYHLK